MTLQYLAGNRIRGTNMERIINGDLVYDEITGATDSGTNNTIIREGEEIQTGHASIGRIVTSVRFLLKKNNSPTGTLYVRCYNSTGTLVTTFGSMNVSTLTTSFKNYYFSNDARTIVAGDRFVFEYSGDSTNTVICQQTTSSVISNADFVYYNGSWNYGGTDINMTLYSPIIQNNVIFEETDTNKFYQYNSTTGLWTYITP